jgi:hypothetical protein
VELFEVALERNRAKRNGRFPASITVKEKNRSPDEALPFILVRIKTLATRRWENNNKTDLQELEWGHGLN